MANTVYKVEEVELQDGSLVTLRPANIKVLRKGQEMINKLSETEDEDDGIRRLLDIACLCLKRQREDFEHEVEQEDGSRKTVPNYDVLEEVLDLDTVFKVIEVYLGVKLNDPKMLEEAAKIALAEQAKAQNSTS